MNGETIDSLRVHVRRGLDRFCLGHYFMEYGLQESVKLIPDSVDVDNLEAAGLTDKKHPFQIFLKAVASEIVKEKDATSKGKERKKMIKEYWSVLQAFQEEWIEFIRKNMRKKINAKNNNTSSQSLMSSPDPNKSDPSTPGASEKKKKGGKRGPRGPYKKRKEGQDQPDDLSLKLTDPNKRQKVEDVEAARREFEKEKIDVMKRVPHANKEVFNQVGTSYYPSVYLLVHGFGFQL